MVYLQVNALSSFVNHSPDARELRSNSSRVQPFREHTLESMGYLDEINSADNLRRIVQGCHFIFVLSSLKWRTLLSNLLEDQT